MSIFKKNVKNKVFSNNIKFALVCSSGGHFLELSSLSGLWDSYDHFWVTFKANDTDFLLKEERVFYAFFPTNRNITNLLRNLFLAFRILSKEKPEVLITTGAGISVPFIFVAILFGIKTIYVESLTRINDLSLSGKLVYPILNHLFVQWPELEKKYKKAKFAGQVI